MKTLGRAIDIISAVFEFLFDIVATGFFVSIMTFWIPFALLWIFAPRYHATFEQVLPRYFVFCTATSAFFYGKIKELKR